MSIPSLSVSAPPAAHEASEPLGVEVVPAAVAGRPAALVPAEAPEEKAPVPVRRLLVLIPEELYDETALARQIWSAATQAGLEVVYLSLCGNFGEEAAARRRLIRLAALTRDNRMEVDADLAIGRDWLELLHAHTQPGDMIVCHAEQQVSRRGAWHPLSQVLKERLDTPVRTLSGYCVETTRSRHVFVDRVLAWAVPLAIVAAFFWLQVQIQVLAKDWLASAALIVTVLIEFGLIVAWHHYTS